jgi:hypothetical protein
MIVPPTTAKSEFFDNAVVRQLWRGSFEGLRAAERIFVVGYSLPPADLLVRSMLSDAVGDAEVWIVNPDPEVERRFREIEAVNMNTTYCGRPVDMNQFVSEVQGRSQRPAR